MPLCATGTNYNSASGSVVSNLWYTTQIMAPIYPVYEHNTDGSFNLDANGNRIYDYGLNRIALSNSNAIACCMKIKKIVRGIILTPEPIYSCLLMMKNTAHGEGLL